MKRKDVQHLAAELVGGITKDEHDELVAAKGRPYTQGPIRKRRQVDDPDMGGLTTLDGVLAEHLRRQKGVSDDDA